MPEQSSFVSKIKEILQYALILVVGLGIGLGAKQAWTWYNTPPAFIETNTAPHFANVEQKVVIYSASWCNFCKATRKYLEDNNIPYIDRDIGIGVMNEQTNFTPPLAPKPFHKW